MNLVDWLNGWGVPVVLVSAFVIMQIIGEIVEICGKTAPFIFKLRKAISSAIQKSKLRDQQFTQVQATLNDVKSQQAQVAELLNHVHKHYDEDNIAKRDKWMLSVNSKMKWVDERAKVYDGAIDRLLSLESTVKEQIGKAQENGDKLDLAMEMTSQMYKDSNRNRILDFAHKLVNDNRRAEKPVLYSREEFRKIHRTYQDYEAFLEKFGGTNGEVDDAMQIIRRAEAGEFPNIEFLEDLRD